MTEEEINAVLQKEVERAGLLAQLFQSKEGGPAPRMENRGGREFSTQEKLDTAATTTMGLPIVGDVAGLAADAHMYATDEGSRNWLNYVMTAAGMLPFVPAASQARKVAQSLGDSKLSKVDVSISERPNQIVLNKIIVPEDIRGQGVGSEAMQELIAKEDAEGKTISLDPSGDFGGNPKRLKEFYKRLGFVENKGKNRDFEISEDMYRPAQPLPESNRITAYHGSPHDFDKFSMDKIGTGEGAQAYGHGLYFAESEDVAKGYRRSTSYADTRRNFLEELPQDADFEEVMGMVGTGRFSPYQERVLRELEADDWLGFDYPSQAISAAYRNIDNFDPSPSLREAVEGSGSMYQVEISASPDELLDWDAPLSEQPEKVREAAKPLIDQAKKSFPDVNPDDLTGEGFYRMYGQHRGGNLSEMGDAFTGSSIKGIKYKDGFSRGAEGGTSNYVIFDDRLITISKKYGIAIPAAAALLAKETGEDTEGSFKEI